MDLLENSRSERISTFCHRLYSARMQRRELKERFEDTDTPRIVSGMDGLIEVATLPEAEILVTAIVGMIGIRPTIAAIKAGKRYRPGK